MEILRIISLISGVVLAFIVVRNFKKGEMLNIPSSVPSFKFIFKRAENPVSFWIATVSFICMIALLILFGSGII